MYKIKVERDAFVLDAQEVQKLKQILKYYRHRYNQHPECSARRMNLDTFAEYAIKKLEE